MLQHIPELYNEGYRFAIESIPNQVVKAKVTPFESIIRGIVRVEDLIAGKLVLYPSFGNLFLGLSPTAGVLEYNSLSFGFSFSEGQNLLIQKQWPAANERYISSDQPYIVAARINYQPETDYTLTLWCQNSGQRYEAVYEILTPATPTFGETMEDEE
jgi:hypothetical protein